MKKEIITTHYLATINKPELNGIRELSLEDFTKYSSYIKTLSSLSANENLFKLVELNYFDLKAKTETCADDFIQNHQAHFSEFNDVLLDVNRVILNFLSSVRSYLDYTETRLNREFGEKSDEFKKFKQVTSQAFDNNFSYRFLTKLRNYSQHCGLPSGSLSISNTTKKNKLILLLVRDELLESHRVWGSIVREEIRNLNSHFDILSLIDHKYKLLKNINKEINIEAYSKYVDPGRELLALIKETKVIGGIPCLIKATGTETRMKLTNTWFPFDAIAKATGTKIIVKTPKKKVLAKRKL